jgi:hypothetical protein
MALWLAGIIAGLIAGIAMAMVAMMLMPMMGRDMWSPVKLMAGTFQGEAALEGGAGTILLGMMIHMGMSAVLGLIFALIVAGIVYALIVWAVNQYATLPVVDKVMAERMPPMAFAVTHVFYGAVLGWLVAVFA